MHLKKRWYWVTVLIIVITYLASGIYVVNTDESGVVRRFGAVLEHARKVPPGVHYAFPWPISRVDRPKKTEIKRLYIGITPAQRLAISKGDWQVITASIRYDVLTGDVNILKVTMVVQYHVASAADYLFHTHDVEGLVRSCVQAELIRHLAGLPVDQSLTTAKAALQSQVLRDAQVALDRYGAGVRLVAVDLESIEPPRATIGAFQDVLSAKKDGERLVQQAKAKANSIVLSARGKAAEIREAARGYELERKSQARAQAGRFLGMLSEYRKQPSIFEHRTLMDTLQKILPDVRVYVLDPDRSANLKLIETESR